MNWWMILGVDKINRTGEDSIRVQLYNRRSTFGWSGVEFIGHSSEGSFYKEEQDGTRLCIS
jgi:hypothetical protein